MSTFSIGSSAGSGASKAREIPEGVTVRIVDVSIEKSRYTQVIQKGPNAGQEQPKYQLKVVLEANGKTYSQYLGGVYPRGEGYTFTEDGSAGVFVKSLKDAGLPLGGDLASLVNLTFTSKHRSGGHGKMAYTHIVAAPNSTPAKATVASKPAPVQAKAATPAATNAFTALPEADRALIQDATKDGTTLLPQELVEAGIAKDTTHASAILDGLKATQAPAPKLARK